MTITIEELNELKQAPVEGLLPTLTHRWSPRAFDETPIPDKALKVILEAARWTQSSGNGQPWRFLVGRKGTPTHDKILAALMPSNQAWADKPDVLILGVGVHKDAKGKVNAYAMYDLGAAASNLVLQASSMGLMCHSMGGFEHDAVRQSFGLSEDYTLGAVIAIGHQNTPDSLANESLREREVARRERKPLSEIALTELGTPLEV